MGFLTVAFLFFDGFLVHDAVGGVLEMIVHGIGRSSGEMVENWKKIMGKIFTQCHK